VSAASIAVGAGPRREARPFIEMRVAVRVAMRARAIGWRSIRRLVGST